MNRLAAEESVADAACRRGGRRRRGYRAKSTLPNGAYEAEILAAQRGHEIAFDAAKECVRSGASALEVLLEQRTWHHEHKSAFAGRGGERRWQTVDQPDVAECASGPGESHGNSLAPPFDRLLDGAVERDIERLRELALGDEGASPPNE